MTEALKDREPYYHSEWDNWCWVCANRGADVREVVAFSRQIIPWEVYWLMSGSLGAKVAEYATEAEAIAALAHGLTRYQRGERG